MILNHFRRPMQFLHLVILALALRAYPTHSAFGVEPSKGETEIERLDKEGSRALATCYEYDKLIPLEPRTVERSKKDNALSEKIVFRGVQGFLVPAYFQLPIETDGPHPCVLLLHGWSGSKEDWWENDNYISGGNVRRALVAAGFAVLALDAQCYGDRISQNDFAPVNHFDDSQATIVGR